MSFIKTITKNDYHIFMLTYLFLSIMNYPIYLSFPQSPVLKLYFFLSSHLYLSMMSMSILFCNKTQRGEEVYMQSVLVQLSIRVHSNNNAKPQIPRLPLVCQNSLCKKYDQAPKRKIHEQE
jgi:hypothetical protein